MVVDRGGNSASAGARIIRTVTPTAFEIAPSEVAMAVGDEKVITVTTDIGSITGTTGRSTIRQVNGSRVMNPNGAVKPPAPKEQLRDDYLDFVPMAPTACDIRAVKNANLK